jgi:hypothetical protein
MELSKDEIKKIEEMAGLFFTIEEIAEFLALPTRELSIEIRRRGTPISEAYWQGKYAKMIELRKKVVDYAQKGSSQADNLVDKFLKNQQMFEK